MKAFETADIRNVALAGHSGAGKTTLAEAILYLQKRTDRMGNITDGNTVSDYDHVEIRRGHSINASLLPVEYNDVKINLLDLPGRPDFVGETKCSLRVADSLVLVLDATAGIEVGAEFAWDYADEFGIAPRVAFVNMMDKDQADFDKVVAALTETFSKRAVPVALPVGSQADFKGVVDLVKMKLVEETDRKIGYSDIPGDMADAANEARAKLVEAAAEGDDDLMMKFLEDEPLSDEEVLKGLKGAVAEGRFIPVCCGSAVQSKGLAPLLDLIKDALPNPAEGRGLEAKVGDAGEAEKFGVSPDGKSLLYIYKTVSDPYTGHLSFFKVMRGKAESECAVHNLNKGKNERIAHVLTVCGQKNENTATLAAGDLGAVSKLDSTKTCDTLSVDGKETILFEPTPLPQPNVQMAVVAKVKADEDKVGLGFHRLMDQDPTLHLRRDPEIHQTILSGMGDVHLSVAAEHLKEMSKVEIELEIPHVAYRETITKKAEGQGKFKKQSGGRGQYGDCWIRMEPMPEGTGFEFDWAIVGGVIPTKFEPSVQKGLIGALEKGVLSGHPTVDLKAVCYDGSFHAVDSSDMAFKVAASMAFKNVAPHAKPAILEPIYKVKISVPQSFMGDIMGDLNSRRGRILGMEDEGRRKIIEAHVPLSEMFTYGRELRSMTRGAGLYELEYDHYERVPGDVQEKVIAESQKEKEAKA